MFHPAPDEVKLRRFSLDPGAPGGVVDGMRLAWASPSLGLEEQAAVLECLASGRVSMGARVRAFEDAMCRTLGVTHAVALSSGTAALDVALQALDVGPGDEVIVPAFTYVATVNAVVRRGALPVMVDVEPRTLNVDPDAVRAALTSRTRGVVFIDYGGGAADHAALERIARDHDTFLLHDAAHSVGTAAHGRRVGAWGVAATLSFHVAKVVTSVEGGMVVTNDDRIAEIARTLRNQGEPVGTKYVFTMIGHNFRLSDLHAAIGLVQLEKLDALLARRAAVAEWYAEALRDVDEVALPAVRAGTVHGRFLFSILARDRALRDRIEAALGRAGIETRICWPLPVYRQRAYVERVRPLSCPVAEDVATRVLSLPFHPLLTPDDVGLVARTLREAIVRTR